ncbi:SCO family protein [Fluoribacter dumoffii]|uniref:BsSco n=1 Tax=Fluoribacter dumoffii TaxID=463 RepID=A0A377GDH6_9GAMM|nr:SCO family protein [Fluoribacter dumoffii]KTC90782.1 SCO1/SenC family transporter protein [Fluoribacter dumoffii NY 23]MCW8386625.1 SCO family protein [Fluoribacter dumoffii]MCW8419679.1 SCO family protein [Fluoribacter dumoffii]MCW8455618.1 SCO family protein [Fluoribacter dumoffii]MCW8460303.1 SCO family protein [Fluoribacter dumoffii]
MSLKARSVTFTVVVVLALAGLFSGIFVGQHFHFKKKIDVTTFHGTYLENPRPVNRFSLTGTDEKSFDNKSLKDKWTLMFFGFTNCGYVCPTTMAELSKMYRILEEKGVKNLPHIVMVSIDPERDSPEKLRSYVTSFHPDFYGARGDENSIKAMTREMGIAYAKIIEKGSDDSKNYDIQHSGALMLFNPQGELNAFFTTPHHADLLAKDYLLLVS